MAYALVPALAGIFLFTNLSLTTQVDTTDKALVQFDMDLEEKEESEENLPEIEVNVAADAEKALSIPLTLNLSYLFYVKDDPLIEIPSPPPDFGSHNL